jgi:hypothetical protein
MGLLTFSLNVTLDGCVDHQEGIADKFLVHPRIAGHGPTLYQSGLLNTRRLELVSATPLRCGAVAMHDRRER